MNKEFSLTSPGLKNNDPCPLEYVMPKKGGKNISPYLKWENAPEGTKSFVLTCIDPHPVANYWVHWMVINIPASTREIPLDASNKKMPAGCADCGRFSDPRKRRKACRTLRHSQNIFELPADAGKS